MYTTKEIKIATKLADKGQLFFISKEKNDYFALPQKVRYIIINEEIYDRQLDIPTDLKYIQNIFPTKQPDYFYNADDLNFYDYLGNKIKNPKIENLPVYENGYFNNK